MRCPTILLIMLLFAAPALAQSASEDEVAPLDELEELEELDDEDFADFLPEEAAESEADDPLEDINRPVFEMNLAIDRYLFRPVARAYLATPEIARNRVSSFVTNLGTPVTLANDLLQGEMSRAGASFGRFLFNSVFGLFGLFDVADAMGLPGHQEDFGQTLASYGVGPGPYLVLPFFGPSNPRDAVGRIVEIVANPTDQFIPSPARLPISAVSLVDARSRTIDETEALEATSLDFYAAVRSLYNQNREFEILNGRPAPEALPDIEVPDIEDSELDEPKIDEPVGGEPEVSGRRSGAAYVAEIHR